MARADKIQKISDKKFSLVLHQGWKRQIRRMCEELGFKVLELKKTRVGKIELGNLEIGKYKQISKL